MRPPDDRDTCRRRGELHAWLAGETGRCLLDGAVTLVGRRVPDLFGYHIVQVGSLFGHDLMLGSRIQNRVVVQLPGEPTPSGPPAVLGRAAELPIESDSVDVVILPYVLEFEADPHGALREAARLLVPDGRLIVAGFSPRSLIGLWALARRRAGVAPWSGRYLSVGRLKDWMALLGFDVCGVDGHFFRPPVGNPRLLRRLEFIERVLGRAAPFLAGGYVLEARKRTSIVKPIRPRWTRSRRVVGIGLARPSTRTWSRQSNRD